MWGIRSRLSSYWLETAWVVFAVADLVAMLLVDPWATVPFHFIWVSLTLLYGLRVWRPATTALVLGAVMISTGVELSWAALNQGEQWGEVTEVPLMAAMFLAMVWHARRRQSALERVRLAADREREFVRDASHQLRTPITVARGHAELIREAGAGEQAAGDAEVILEELDRLSSISDALLLLASAEHPNFLQLRWFDFERLIVNTARRWGASASRRWVVGVSVEGLLLADEERLGHALDALIENAIKFTQEDDSIVITGSESRGDAVIGIADSGVGIPAEDHARIFERFARVEGPEAGAGGTGLGLSIVKAIVEAHAGSVTIKSEVGKGSAFTIRLPGFQVAAEDAHGLLVPFADVPEYS